MVKKVDQSQFDEVRKSKAAVVDFYNVDVDENPDLAREFRIMNIPAVVALKDGQIVGQQIGFVPKEDLKNFVEGSFK